MRFVAFFVAALATLGAVSAMCDRHEIHCACPAGSYGLGVCVNNPGETLISVCQQSDTKALLEAECEVQKYVEPTSCLVSCQIGSGCSTSCQCPASPFSSHQYVHCPCKNGKTGNGLCVYSPNETFISVCDEPHSIRKLDNHNICHAAPTTPSCPKVCNMDCIQGSSCQADANGCVSCQPTPAPTTPSCPKVCTQDCIQGSSCQADANGCVACRPSPVVPTTPACPKVCNMMCMQGSSCQADANGCVSCQPTPTTPSCPKACIFACIQGSSCQADANGCFSCQPSH